MPRISIIIPLYNSERFIGTTLDSVIAQTYEDWECIVVDDASTDDSASMIRRYAEADSRIRPIFHKKNGGAAVARNSALEEVRGAYVAFLDADDYWVPQKLELQLRFAEEVGAAIVHSSYRFVGEEGNFLRGGVKASDRVDLRSYMRNTEIGMSTSLIDCGKVGEFRLEDIRLCQDTNLWLELLGRGFVSRGLRETLVHYRVREGQLSGSKVAMAKQVFALWMRTEQVSPPERVWCFFHYALNGVRKRLGGVS